MHPCGEVVDEQTLSERSPFTLTLCVLFVKKFSLPGYCSGQTVLAVLWLKYEVGLC